MREREGIGMRREGKGRERGGKVEGWGEQRVHSRRAHVI